MIRFGGVDPKGRGIIGLAIGPEELKALGDGERIVLDGENVGHPGVVVFVVFGKTDQEAIDMVRKEALEAGAHAQPLEEALDAMKKSNLQ